MILTINIENSIISVGGVEAAQEDAFKFEDKRQDAKKEPSCQVLFHGQIAADTRKTMLDYALHLKTIFEVYQVQPDAVEGSIISSVVPQLTPVLAQAVRILTATHARIVGPGLKTGLSILIDNPAQLGSDLAAVSVGGAALYGGPLILISMGTATTYCVLNEKKQYIGGIIMPGMRVAMDGLTAAAAQLASVSLEKPKKLIGTNTADCLRSGILYGTAAGIDGMISRICEELGMQCRVVALGAYAEQILPCCKSRIYLDKDLLMKGLYFIYERNKSQKSA